MTEEYSIDLEEALGVAMEAARKAGSIMWDFYQYRQKAVAVRDSHLSDDAGAGTNAAPVTRSASDLLDVKAKSSPTDLVTHYDKLCDETIIKTLREFTSKVEREKCEAGFKSFQFYFITEEIKPDAPLTNAPTWIVDPIDGTMSFVHGLCDCCVSIGLSINKKTVLAAVYCPFLPAPRNTLTTSISSSAHMGELYTAIRGKGAFLNGHPIHVRTDATLSNALVTFTYPMGVRLSEAELQSCGTVNIDDFKRQKHQKVVEAAAHIRRCLVKQPVHAIRSYGACVLILSQIAAGRVDLYMEPAGMVWDVCAGSLLVTEAGGVVKNIWGGEFSMEGGTTIIAGANETLAMYGAELCVGVSYGDFWKRSQKWEWRLLPVFIKILTGGETSVGWCTASYGIAQILGAMVAGYAGDIMPRKEVVRTGAACGLIAVAATLVAVRFLEMPLLYVTQALWGVYTGMVSTGSEALFADSVPSGQRGFIYNFKWMVQILCYCVGYLVVLVMLFQMGNDWDIRSVQLIMAVGLFAHPIAHILLFFLRHEIPISQGGIAATILSGSEDHENQGRISSAKLESPLLGEGGQKATSCGGEQLSSLFVGDSRSLNSSTRKECGSQVGNGTHRTTSDGNCNNDSARTPVNTRLAVIEAFLRSLRTFNTLNAVPYLVCFTELLVSIGSGMTLQYITLFLVYDLGIQPTWMMGSYITISLTTALCTMLVRYVGEGYIGRVASVIVVRAIGTTLLMSLAFAKGPMMRLSVILPILIIRNAAMNSTTGTTRSVIMDCVRKESRAKWSAFESFTNFAWAGSAVIGGYIAEAKGYQYTFFITAIFHYFAVLGLVPAAIAMRVVERRLREARR